MRRVFWSIVVGALFVSGAVGMESPGPDDFATDFAYAVAQVADQYAYFDLKATRWNEVKALYGPDLAAVHDKRQFIALLEHVVDELYDPHAQLTVNTSQSMRLVPSGADLWATWQGNRAIIVEVRADSDADRAGIRQGEDILSINSVPIAEAVNAQMGRTYDHSVAGARDWALRAVLAGRHNQERTLIVRARGATRTVVLPAPDQIFNAGASQLQVSRLPSTVGLIRVDDSLGDEKTVGTFDEALRSLRDTRALILDLRNTASGGNSVVARGLLGRFVDREVPYQKHVLPAEERETGIRRSWLELVSPRGPFKYDKPVVILVDHWTGSMGEGLAIGFDAVERGVVIGTPMAGLLGATGHITLPRTGIGLNLPAERLYHVNGTPRESFRPRVMIDLAAAAGGNDPFIAAALQILNGQ